MRIKQIFGKVTASALVCTMLMSLGNTVSADAQTNYKETDVLETSVDTEVRETLHDTIKDFEYFNIDDVCMDTSGIALIDAIGDSYEANNGPAVATIGRYNSITYGSIHEENDVDWYEIEIVDINTPVSIVLTDIPANCDYDMYIVQYDSTNGITGGFSNLQSGTTAEEIYAYFETVGTYYVVIQPDATIENNFSTTNYKLYIGDYYRTGQYGYVDTGLDINFGYIATGNTVPSYKGWYVYDLSNNTSIPDGAIATKIQLTGTGNSAYWLGFYKMLYAYDQNIVLDEKVGQIEIMYMKGVTGLNTDDDLYVKQRWCIGGHILASTNFIWEPKILFVYEFQAVLSNLNYL